MADLPHHDLPSSGGTNQRHRRLVALLVFFVAFVAVMPTGVAQVADDEAADGPPWRDLAAAQADLDRHLASIEQTRNNLAATLSEKDSLAADLDTAGANDADVVSALERARGRARSLAIEAYIHSSSPASIDYIIGAQEANDLAFRLSLLRSHAETTLEASIDYLELRDVTNEELEQLAIDLDQSGSRIEQLQVDLVRLERQTADLEWVVEIATIHDLADQAFAAFLRPEPTEEQWENLRQCESTGNYAVNVGNGFYGAYQFDWNTWPTVGGTGNPADASVEEQDARARLLFAQRGSQPWPECGRFLP